MKKQTKENKTKTKVLCLLSGGLDSRLAIKILQQQAADIKALYIELPFGAGCCNPACAFKFAKSQGVRLHILDCRKGKLFKKYLDIIKKPKYGYGSEMNPCIDCRIFMLREAVKLAKKIGADVIATGEVLGERPMSQRKKAMELIEKEVKLEGKLLRPLSALLLPQTKAEQQGKIDRSKLLAIQGRCRKPQLELAKKFGISFPTPAGGCILCDKEFCKRLTALTEHKKNISMADINLLRLGRHFFTKTAWIIVGRNEQENNKILEIKERNKKETEQKTIEISNIPSPTTLIKKFRKKVKITKEDMDMAKEMTIKYSAKKRAEYEKIKPKIITI